ncbi:hypothetical protein [Mesorhizobium sp. CAU 1732]|uniref:hypothetical protein n=1 Tax=Mesorhizobium sp. CAU 1732 TaxID=3140358 RepID=UPI003261A505
MSADRANERRLSTGAPLPAPIWQMICEFANGSCVCAATSGDGGPCHAVDLIARRVTDRAYHDLSQSHDLRRKSRHAG